MQYGAKVSGTDNGENKTEVKDIFAKGDVIRRYFRDEEQRLVGETGNEVKDITAHFFTALGKYQKGEVHTFGIVADHVDPKTGRISRIKVITETQEKPS